MKKQLIFKEVLAMLNAGTEYKAITLAEVAKRCKMGKSTIYEYFSSKDEMIYNAIIFYINKMLKFFSSSFKISTFEPSIKIWVKAMMVCMKSNKWMLLPWTFNTYSTYLDKEDAARATDLLGKSQTIIIKLLTAICKKGEAEGFVVDTTESSIEYAYYGAIALLAKYVGEDFDYTSAQGTWLTDYVIAQITKHLSSDPVDVPAPEEESEETEEASAEETEEASAEETEEVEETEAAEDGEEAGAEEYTEEEYAEAQEEYSEEYAEEDYDGEYTEDSEYAEEYAEDGDYAEYAEEEYATEDDENTEYAEEDYDGEYAEEEYAEGEYAYSEDDDTDYEAGPEDIDYE